MINFTTYKLLSFHTMNKYYIDKDLNYNLNIRMPGITLIFIYIVAEISINNRDNVIRCRRLGREKKIFYIHDWCCR